MKARNVLAILSIGIFPEQPRNCIYGNGYEPRNDKDVMERLLATDESQVEVTSTAAAQIYIGPFRVYWEEGNLWAIDHGDMESWATYPEVYINCPVATRTQPKNDNVDEPRAWVEGYGVISVAGDGAAFIYAHR